jgi:hypothetical protein
MQGCESAGDERIHHRMKQLIYPENCGYRSVTGGLMKKLRELSVEQSKRVISSILVLLLIFFFVKFAIITNLTIDQIIFV